MLHDEPPLPPPKAGLHCPRCGSGRLDVTHTRPQPDSRIKRYRRCRSCGRRVLTYEVFAAALRRLRQPPEPA